MVKGSYTFLPWHTLICIQQCLCKQSFGFSFIRELGKICAAGNLLNCFDVAVAKMYPSTDFNPVIVRFFLFSSFNCDQDKLKVTYPNYSLISPQLTPKLGFVFGNVEVLENPEQKSLSLVIFNFTPNNWCSEFDILYQVNVILTCCLY